MAYHGPESDAIEASIEAGIDPTAGAGDYTGEVQEDIDEVESSTGGGDYDATTVDEEQDSAEIEHGAGWNVDYGEDDGTETETETDADEKVDYSAYDGWDEDEAYQGEKMVEMSEDIDNSADIQVSSWAAKRAKNMKVDRFSQAAIKARLGKLNPEAQKRMIDYQMSLLEKRMKDAAFKPGFLGKHTWGMFHKNSVKKSIDSMINTFEDIYGSTMTTLGQANSKVLNKQGMTLSAKSLLNPGKTIIEGILKSIGWVYHPIEAEKKFRALKVRYRLADEDDKWYHPSEAENTITGLTKSQCNARSGWYWDDADKICRRGVDPDATEDNIYTGTVNVITGT